MDELDGFHAGDQTVFRRLVDEHGPLVLRVARSFSADEDEAEDLFQEIWLRVYDKRARYSNDAPFVAWLLTVARNTCLSQYRQGRARRRAVEGYRASGELGSIGAPGTRGPGGALEQAEVSVQLNRAILGLTERERLAVVLRLFEDRSAAEAAEVMKCEPATVRSLMRNAVVRLRQLLEDEEQ